ncbi:hypothetical protein BGZ95_004809 [Linnemannia exigua]|uniref:F-box domain-containing protein n=1 Tax=Linnemannia exigua TaxID=604196 RepID=A0AAD4DHB0_9FUNG|nr:hypothetical protein BGZ95_004809 [Linnemannia exigua]
MRNLIWSKLSLSSSSSQKQRQTQQQEAAQPRTSSPLEVVELREHIFSYLDTTDLRRSVLPVCREWFRIYRHLFEKETVWELDLDGSLSKKTIKSVNGSGRLYWHYSDNHSKALRVQKQQQRQQEAQWNELVRALEKNHIRYRQTRRQTTRLKHKDNDDVRAAIFDNPLRHLDFIGFQNLDLLLPPILPFLTFLTTLRLRSRAFGQVSFDAILKACPLLERFQAGMLGVILELSGPWIPVNKQPSGPAHLPLRSFELENATLEYSSLMNLLAICPALQDLRLINVMFMERISTTSTLEALQGAGSGSAPFITQQTFNPNDHAASVLEYVKQIRLRLRSFHISVYAARTLDMDPSTMLSVCPEATEWTFWTEGLTESIVHDLSQSPNNVTSLDLLWDTSPGSRWSSVLHQYLCQSPHLLHLRTPRTRFQVKHLDLHHQLPAAIDSWGANRVHATGIWSCRKLRTLHFTIEWNSNYLGKGPAAARVVFGYLSRVCPRLEDLQLTSKRRDPYECKLWLGLQGGFCLLASLRYLERLHIGSALHFSNFEEWELSWMTPLGLNLDHRRARQARRSGWKAEISRDEQDDLGSTQARGTDVKPCSGAAADDSNVAEALRGLGRVSDVDSMLEQIDSGRFICWPSLQKISLHDDSEIGRHPAAEMRRLFPADAAGK